MLLVGATNDFRREFSDFFFQKMLNGKKWFC